MTYNILHFAFCYFPVYGGMTTRLKNMLADRNCNHILYVPQAPNSYIPPDINWLTPEEQFDNILVKRRYFPERGERNIPVLDYLGDIQYYNRFSSSFLEQAMQERYKVDVVYGHTPLHFAYAAMQFAKKFRIPFIHEAHALIHDVIIENENKGFKSIYHKFFKSLILKYEATIFKNSKIIISQTPFVKERIQEVYNISADKIAVIPNGVDTNLFDPSLHRESRRNIRQQMGWQNKVVFLYSGLFDQINGIDFFLDALLKISPDIEKKMKVVFLGRGPLQQNVEKAAIYHEHVEYLGKIPYEKMPAYYAAADVFVIPRPSCEAAETLMPMKLYEAMSMKKIVLVSSVKPMAEAVENGALGVIYPKGDIDTFIKAISDLVIQPEGYDELTENSRRKVVAECTWQKAHTKLMEIYSSML